MSNDLPPGYVVDTNVLSNRGDVEADPNLIEWLRRNAGLVRISVVTIAEMRRGLHLLEVRVAETADAAVRHRLRRRLAIKQAWYDELTDRFADRILPIDLATAERWAEISVRFPSLRDADKAILATALVRDYGIATENLGNFRRSGVVLVNPFDPGTWPPPRHEDPIARL